MTLVRRHRFKQLPAIDPGTKGDLYQRGANPGILSAISGPTGHDGYVLAWNDTTGLWEARAAAAGGGSIAIEFVIDGASAVISTGLKGWLEVPKAGTITAARLFADQSGSIVVNIYKTTYSAYAPPTHPASGDKITSSTPPTISSATKAQDTTLASWTTSLSAGDILAFNVDSCTTIQRVTLSLTVTLT